MGILASQTIGSTTYVQISEPYPLFSAATNYIAINTDGRMFINIPKSSQWYPLDKSQTGEMQKWGGTGTVAYTSANNGIYAFFGASLVSPTGTTLEGFTVATTPGATAITLSANPENTGRFITTALIGTFIGAANTYDQTPYEIMPVLNNSTFIPTINAPSGVQWGAGTDCVPDLANNEATQYAIKIFDMDGNVGDFTKIASRVYSDGSTTYGTIGNMNYKLSTRLIEEPTRLSFRTFETGTLNGWNYANENQTNKWIIGSGTSYEGTWSAYITSGTTSGSSNSYNATSASVSHLWADIKFPYGTMYGKHAYYVTFRWKCLGNVNDYGNVYLLPRTITPSGGTALSSLYLLDTTKYSGSSTYTTSKIVFSGLSIETTVTGDTYLNETWETGSITGDTGGWTVTNNGTNNWIVGTETASGGTYSAYISNNGSSNTYTITVGQVSHLYRTMSIPSSATSATLTFNWRCVGENAAAATSYDYGTVVIADTGTTPTAGTEVSTTQATVGGNGRIGATTNLGKFNLTYVAGGNWNTETINMTSYIGLNKRLIFTWRNDTSVGVDPPMAIDNIVITYSATTSEPFLPDSDGYVTNKLVFSWVNDASVSNDPPFAIDNVNVYCYPAVANDYTP